MNWSEGLRRVYVVYLAVSLCVAAAFAYVQLEDAASWEREHTTCYGSTKSAQTKPWCSSYFDYTKTAEEVKRDAKAMKASAISWPALTWLAFAFLIALTGKVMRYILTGFRSK